MSARTVGFTLGSLLLLLVTGLGTASAQARTLAEGQRVRLSTATVKNTVGVVSRSTPDSLTLLSTSGEGRITVPVSAIEKLEVSEGKSAVQGAKKGAAWGGTLGAIFGAIFLFAPCESRYAVNDPTTDNCRSEQAAFAAASVGSGLLYGVSIGALVKAEKWSPISLNPRVSISNNRVGFAMAIPGLH